MCETKVAHNVSSSGTNCFLFWRNIQIKRDRASFSLLIDWLMKKKML